MLSNKYITEDEVLSPYIKSLIENDYTYTRGTLVDDDIYIDIVRGWIEWYEKKKDAVIENIYSIYSKLGADTGYSAASERWGEFRHPEKWTKEQIEQQLRGNFVACIAHLYQGYRNKKEDYRSGATGLNIYCSFIIQYNESELKAVKEIVANSITMGINIPTSNRSEIDIYK